MAEHVDNEIETKHESTTEKIHRTDSSSAEEDFDSEKKVKYHHDDDDLKKETVMKSKRKWLFGREKPVHEVFGGGKSADLFLWRNKKISASVLGGATALWVLFELFEYHLVTMVCHGLIFVFSILFLWSATSKFLNKSPPRIPEVRIPEDKVIQVAAAIRSDINHSLGMLRDIASGRDLKKFLSVVAGLWVLSVIGAWCDFLTLFYTTFVVLHTVPVLYEKYEDEINAFAEKAMIEFKKQYAVFDQKVLSKILSKIPKRPLKDKKTA